MTIPDGQIAAVGQRVPVAQNASYAGPNAPSAYRDAEGNVVITGVGYYEDEVTLTAAVLELLGFVPFHAEAP